MKDLSAQAHRQWNTYASMLTNTPKKRHKTLVFESSPCTNILLFMFSSSKKKKVALRHHSWFIHDKQNHCPKCEEKRNHGAISNIIYMQQQGQCSNVTKQASSSNVKPETLVMSIKRKIICIHEKQGQSPKKWHEKEKKRIIKHYTCNTRSVLKSDSRKQESSSLKDKHTVHTEQKVSAKQWLQKNWIMKQWYMTHILYM